MPKRKNEGFSSFTHLLRHPLSKDQLEAGDFSLEELKAILANARANIKAADESARCLKERVCLMEAVDIRKDFINRKLRKKK